MRYKHPTHRKSLLHFDFPYYGEPGDGLRDEVGILKWTRQGGAKLVGVEEPVAENVAGTPKFGYRCLQTATNTDYISASESGNVVPVLCLNGDREYEFEFFVRPTAATAGNIIAVRDASNDLLSIVKDASNKIAVSGMGISLTSTTILALNQFTHVLVRLFRGTASVYVNGQAAGSANGFSGSISATELRVGGVAGQIDEFLFSHRAGTSVPAVPTHPYQGIVDFKTLGGFGDGKHGVVTLSGESININTCAIASGVSASQVYVGTQTVGMFGEFEVGDEIMIHHSLKRDPGATDEANLGLYSIRRIKTINGSQIVLDKPIDEFVPQGSSYYMQVVKIPNFKTLMIPYGVTLIPPTWSNTTGGGIVAFKCSGDCNIQGKIISALTGPMGRTDNLCLTHTDMIDHFVLTGNVFIACGGVLSTGVQAYIGADFDGSNSGGAGGNDASGVYSRLGGKGLVGSGGSGGKGGYGALGGEAGTVGRGAKGGAGCYGGSAGAAGYSAPNVVLIARVMNVNNTSVSVGGGGGGGGGACNGNNAGGGGGAGYAGTGGKASATGYHGGKGSEANGTGTSGQGFEVGTGGAGGGCGYGGGGGGGGRGGGGGGGAGTGFCFIAETGEV